MIKKFFLNDNWYLRLLKNDGVQTKLSHDENVKASVPGTVHTDLLNAGIIEDPYFSDNELKLSWISDCDFIYYTKFDLPAELKDKNITLNFEGIDSISEVILNEKILGKTENLFLGYSFEISEIVKLKDNQLEVKFYSPVKYAKTQQEKYGKIPVPSATNSERVYIRKAQYSFGWDWGPAFPTMGIWKPVYLVESSQIGINNIFFDTIQLADDKAAARLSFDIENNPNKNLLIKIKLSCGEQVIEFEEVLSSSSAFEKIIYVTNPKLWWPNGYGSQNLYNLKIQLIDESSSIISQEIKSVGIRTVKLELEKYDKPTFRFIVNGKRIYAQGVNWIPGDSFLPRVTHDKYNKLLSLAKDASMNMVRVWGGGIYENDEFYDLCDQLGLLVWQDFMFACGSYPEHEEFLSSVKSEIQYNVMRLRNHPSIVIWCGNNENEWIWSFTQGSHYSQMPGHKIFSEIIPSILHSLDDNRPYWQSSPFGFDEDVNSQTSGNRHQWYMWSGWIDYLKVIDDNSLFITEFGFQAPANIDTFKKYIPESNRKIHNRIFEFHNKQIEGPERVIKFLSAHLPLPNNWEDYIYLAQLNQSLALKTCLEHWRLNQPVTNGTIIWQLNDTWPVTSWSLIDSELIPKMSYHFVKQAFQQTTLAFRNAQGEILLHLNNNMNIFAGKLEVALVQTNSGAILESEVVQISPLTEGIFLLKKYIQSDLPESKNWVIIATLFDSTGNNIERNFYIPEKWKYLELASANIKYVIEKNKLKLRTDKPAYFVDVYIPGCTMDDRGFILLPNEEKELTILSYNAKVDEQQIKVFSLNDYLCN